MSEYFFHGPWTMRLQMRLQQWVFWKQRIDQQLIIHELAPVSKLGSRAACFSNRRPSHPLGGLICYAKRLIWDAKPWIWLPANSTRARGCQAISNSGHVCEPLVRASQGSIACIRGPDTRGFVMPAVSLPHTARMWSSPYRKALCLARRRKFFSW